MTIITAKALGVEANVGHLATGMQIDFYLWEITTPAELANAYEVNPYQTVVQNGQIVALPL